MNRLREEVPVPRWFLLLVALGGLGDLIGFVQRLLP